jgi:glycine/D-amino acid oxidase-like deaminating enzyme
VEDDPMIGKAVAEGMQGDGYAVDWVRDGVEAETALLHDVYDVALLDLGLPRKDGLEVLKRLRRASVELPVLIITARDAVADRIVVEAPPEVIWDVIADFEAYPEWNDEITAAEVLETGDDGWATKVRFTVDASVLGTATVVLAGEAWLTRLPGWRRALLPVYSLIVLTEPLDDARWAEIGWTRHECLSSHRYVVDYLSRTADGRILFGGRGAPYHFGSRIAPAYDRHERTHELLRAQLLDWFPPLEGVRFSHAWGGPIGMPRHWLPVFRHDARTGLAGAYGYTGQGVATAKLAGRVLADLVLGRESAFTDLPMVNHQPRRWEPEPLRWLAVRYLQWSLARTDARAARRGRPPSGRTLAERLVRH